MALIDGVLGDGFLAAPRSWRWCDLAHQMGSPSLSLAYQTQPPAPNNHTRRHFLPHRPLEKSVREVKLQVSDANNRIRPPAPQPAPAPAHCNNSAPNWKLISKPAAHSLPDLDLGLAQTHISHITRTIPSHTSCLLQLFSPSSCSLFTRLLPLYLTNPNLH
jgi:hypothetical protein